MEPLNHPTLVAYGSVAETEGRVVRLWRGRTFVYAGLLATIAASTALLAANRIPFEATVNRAPGSLYSVDENGLVRNTYLLNVKNNDPDLESVSYVVTIDGIEGAELLTQEFTLGPTESRIVPLVVRAPRAADMPRSVPLEVRIGSESGELVIHTTFASGDDLGEGS
jgi:hypothetical protein